MPVALILAAIPSPSGNAAEIGPLSIRAYGLAIGVGVLLAIHIAQRRGEARGGDPADIVLVLRDRDPRSCQQAADRLQSFLDREVDPITARHIQAHLERCRRCGMEADVYREIKASLARTSPQLPELTRQRLRHFGHELGAR